MDLLEDDPNPMSKSKSVDTLLDKKAVKLGIIKKTKPISLSPCSIGEDGIMWSDRKAASATGEDVPMQQKPLITTISDKIPMDSTFLQDKAKDKSPLEATFTHPNEPLEEGSRRLSQVSTRLASSSEAGNTGKPTDPTGSRKSSKIADYTALEYVSSSSQTNSLAISISGEEKRHLTSDLIPDEEQISSALLAVLISIINPLWAVGMAYWHYSKGDQTSATLSLVILAVSNFIVHFAYFCAINSPKQRIWKSSKIISLLCAIPTLPPIVLSSCNLIFAIREAKCRSFERPWTNTRYIFLIESLAMTFPQIVLHISLFLTQERLFIPLLEGYLMAAGLAVLIFAMAYSRFRYDSSVRYERFGTGMEMYIRFVYILANKALWVLAYSMAVVSLLCAFPTEQPSTSVIGLLAIFALYEVPLLLTMTPPLGRFGGSVIGLLMMLPQFISLTCLILWVKMDSTVYSSNNGCFILGIFFYGEAITLIGWLYDRFTGREIDFIPVYPHFFGDIVSSLRE